MFRWLKFDGVELTPPQVLAALLLVMLAVVAIWDIYAYTLKQPANTVSYILGTWGGEFPILAVAIGMVIGHLFWPRGPLH